MYQQIQSYPTPFLFLKTPPRNYIEISQAVFALDSLVLVLPLTRAITEDFPPNANLSLDSVFVVPLITPITRTIAEDFPPTATIQLVSVVSIVPLSRTIAEDFPPTANLSLDSVVIITPVTEVLPAEAVNAGVSLQSVVA